MNRRQRALLLESLIVIGVVLISMVLLINLKDGTNRREALRAMAHISQRIQTYLDAHNAMPTPDYIDNLKLSAPGRARLGKLEYRTQAFQANAPDNAILAYTQQTYRSFLIDSGHVVLFRSGQVRWMPPDQFQAALAQAGQPADLQPDDASRDSQ